MIHKQTMENEIRNSGGFTLIEVVVAVGIFAIGMLAVGSMQLSAIKNNGNARLRTEATIAASRQVENLMSLSYGDVDLAPATIEAPYLDQASSSLNGPPVYRIQWIVTDNTPGPNIKTIALTVCWYDDRGIPDSCAAAAGLKTVSLEFIRADL